MLTSLNTYEMQLVTDSQVLITKNNIIKKVSEIFGNLAEKYKNAVGNKISGCETLINPKISKGENYKGLPYVILDFPRQFSKTDIFAIRSFFWWGNFFSITVQLTGQYQQRYAAAIQYAIDNKFYEKWYISISENQWEHHFESDNYVSLSRGVDYSIAELPYLKLAKKIPLNKWDETNAFFIENFTMLAATLGIYAPIL